jgi:hypothetical protein
MREERFVTCGTKILQAPPFVSPAAGRAAEVRQKHPAMERGQVYLERNNNREVSVSKYRMPAAEPEEYADKRLQNCKVLWLALESNKGAQSAGV